MFWRQQNPKGGGNMLFIIIVSVPVFSAKPALTHRGMASTLKVWSGIWHQEVSSRTLRPVTCEVGPTWIGVVCLAHPTGARLDWHLGNLEAKSTPQTRCCALQTRERERERETERERERQRERDRERETERERARERLQKTQTEIQDVSCEGRPVVCCFILWLHCWIITVRPCSANGRSRDTHTHTHTFSL